MSCIKAFEETDFERRVAMVKFLWSASRATNKLGLEGATKRNQVGDLANLN